MKKQAWGWLTIICLFIPAFANYGLASYPTYPIEARGLSDEKACDLAKTHLVEGDLIFLAIDNYIFKNIARMSNSWVSHVGIATRNQAGEWTVLESTIPQAKRTPLCHYLARTKDARFAIRRLYRPLAAVESQAVIAFAEGKLGTGYDTGFNFNSDRQFCSKLVYQAYLDATGMEIGRKETFDDLRKAHPEIDYTFAEVWFFGNIPWERVTVTPASQYEDQDLFTIVESY